MLILAFSKQLTRASVQKYRLWQRQNGVFTDIHAVSGMICNLWRLRVSVNDILQGFGLQIGSDLYLLLDRGARHALSTLSARMSGVIVLTGTFVSDNGTFTHINDGNPLDGTFTFSNTTSYFRDHIVEGCFRPPQFSWYLQPFPWWTQFFIVPVFSIMSSLLNLQPLWTWELVVMVIISCASYAANKVANHFIFNRSDVVSAIGAFAVGILGNAYSRRMGGTAFTSMVTGVLFLVPVSGAL